VLAAAWAAVVAAAAVVVAVVAVVADPAGNIEPLLSFQANRLSL
jgi:hypothetical protein